MARACIVGWAHTPFGKLEDPDGERLIAHVSGEALKHADVGPEAVNGIYVGAQATHVENACATGSAVLYTAMDFIESGRGRVALVVGAEKNDRNEVG
jgi:acetyl-CoA C-acetyltransferase